MTRDEAIKISQKKSAAKNFDEALVDALSGLGILKLDEPKSALDIFYDEMVSRGYNRIGNVFADVVSALEKANLKIVEK